jgi:hypothetical protein
MQTSILALLPILCLAAACGDSAATVVDAGPDASTAPTLAVTASSETVPAGGSVTLTVEVENFEIVNPMTTPGVEPGKGHFHHQLDTAPAYTAAWTPSVTVPIGNATPPGEHTIDVWLVTGNHVDIEPPTHTPVTITVE